MTVTGSVGNLYSPGNPQIPYLLLVFSVVEFVNISSKTNLATFLSQNQKVCFKAVCYLTQMNKKIDFIQSELRYTYTKINHKLSRCVSV